MPDLPNPNDPNDPTDDPTPDTPSQPNQSNRPIRLNSKRSKESWSTFAFESILAFDTVHDIQFLDFTQLSDKHACFAALIAQSILGHIKLYATSTDQFLQVQYNGYTKNLSILLDEHPLIQMQLNPPNEEE